MDPVSLILGALTSGATKGATDVATDAVKDAYGRLIQIISRRFASSKPAQVALAEYPHDPEIWHAPLAKALAEAGVDTDGAVIDAAQRMMALLDAAGTQAGKYTVDLGDAKGVQVGDNNHQVNVFTTPPQFL